MRSFQFVMCLCVAAAIATGGGCSNAKPSEAERTPANRSAHSKVKVFDRPGSPLPPNPPIRFKKVFALPGETGRFTSSFLEFSPDGNVLAAAPYDTSGVTIWDVQKRERLHVLPDPSKQGRVVPIAFVPPGHRVVTGAFLWDVRTGKLLDTLGTGASSGLAAFPDGKRVLCSTWSAGLIVWDTESKTQETMPETAGRGCHSVGLSSDGSRFAFIADEADRRKSILICDAKTRRVTKIIPLARVRNPPRFAFAPDGTTVAASYNDPNDPDYPEDPGGGDFVGVWDATSGKKLLVGKPFKYALLDLAYTRDGKYLLATNMRDGIGEGPEVHEAVVGVWEVATGRLVNEIWPAGFTLTRIAVSADNKLLAVPTRGRIDIYAIEYADQPKRD